MSYESQKPMFVPLCSVDSRDRGFWVRTRSDSDWVPEKFAKKPMFVQCCSVRGRRQMNKNGRKRRLSLQPISDAGTHGETIIAFFELHLFLDDALFHGNIDAAFRNETPLGLRDSVPLVC